MQYTNWILIAISVAVHLIVIASLQINVGGFPPVQNPIMLQLHRQVSTPIQQVTEAATEVPISIPAMKSPGSEKRTEAASGSRFTQPDQPQTDTDQPIQVEPIATPIAAVETEMAPRYEVVAASPAGFATSSNQTQDINDTPIVQSNIPPAPLQQKPSLPDIPETQPMPAVDIAELLRSYAGGVKREILATQSYPATAQRLGHEGTVQVGFTIASDGSLGSVKVKSSSGYDAIDSAAISAVNNAAPFNAIPLDAQRESLSMRISLKYYLE